MIDEKVMKDVITSIVASDEKELFSKTQEELEEYWFFNFTSKDDLPKKMYKFHKALRLYSNYCRRWEEHHNGSCCVVERVRGFV